MNLNFENKTGSCLFYLDCKVEFILFEFPLKHSKMNMNFLDFIHNKVYE